MIRERALHLGGQFALGDSIGAQFQLRIFLPLGS
jgi:signal transduction histidine kinase